MAPRTSTAAPAPAPASEPASRAPAATRRKPASPQAPVQAATPAVIDEPAGVKRSRRAAPAGAKAKATEKAAASAEAHSTTATLEPGASPGKNTKKPQKSPKPQALVRPPAIADMTPGAALQPAAQPARKKRAKQEAATQPTRADRSKTNTAPLTGVKLFQTFQAPWQRDLLEPGCIPVDQSAQPAELPELSLPLALLGHTATASLDHWGVVSWRLVQQTGLSAQALLRAIDQHPGADVYHAHADSAEEGLFHNAWLELETQHPGLLGLVTALFQRSGLPQDTLLSVHASAQYSNGTVLVGNRGFWSRYVPFLQRVLAQAQGLDEPQRARLQQAVQDDSALNESGSVMGLIVRRLLPVFLSTEGKDLKVHKLALAPKDKGLNVHQQLLREMKQMAHSSQSSWLAACWVNYRNLYLNQSKGKAWCQQHLRAITPADIRFA